MPEAGWYHDPDNRDRLRYWDGQEWTEHVHDPSAYSPPAAAGLTPAQAEAPTQVLTTQPAQAAATPTVVYHREVPPTSTRVARGCLGGLAGVVLALVAVVLAIIIIVVVAIGHAAHKASTPGAGSSAHPAAADVALTGCAVSPNEFEGPAATLLVTNRSTKPSNYLIEVAFDAPDGKTQLDTGTATVDNLTTGQNTTVTAASLNANLRGQPFTCKVVEVTRLAATP